MKELDRVRLIKDRAEYSKRGINKGDVGTLMLGEQNGYVLVFFDGEPYKTSDGITLLDEIDIGVRVEDLEVLNENDPGYIPKIY